MADVKGLRMIGFALAIVTIAVSSIAAVVANNAEQFDMLSAHLAK